MFKLNLLLAIRSLKKYKISFLINLIGLTTGLACFILIYLWVDDELKMNQFHENNANLYQVMEHQQYAEDIMTTYSTPGLLAETLAEEVPEIKYAATTTWIDATTLTVDDLNIKADGYHVGADYFNIFSYGLVQGDPDKVLADKSSIVISEELAHSLFKSSQDVIGRTVEYQHEKSFIVSGVFKGTPANSSFQFDYVLPFEDYKDDNDWVLSWGNNGPSTFVVLRDGAKGEDVSAKIADFVSKREEESHVTLFLKPYADRYLYSSYENGIQDGGRIEYVQLFSIIAIFILLIACINFMNLSTARASRRAKEVGIKKAIGARQGSLIYQFLSESLMITLISMIIALLIVVLFLPSFNLITEKNIYLNLGPERVGHLIGIAIVTGILAGSYPALYLSNFKPVKVLKGTIRGSMGELWIRRGLVIFQFALSVILIVAVVSILRQVEYVQNKNLGYNKENVIRFPIEGRLESNLETFLSEARELSGIVSASSIGHSMMGRQNNTSGLKWEGKDPNERILFENVRVNHDLIETMGIAIAEGRSFDRKFRADTSKIIFNETAINIMGFDEPIGKVINLWDEIDLEIVGVVEDFNFQSLHEDIKPLFIHLSPENTWNVMMRIEAGKERVAISNVKNFYERFNPGFSFDYDFMDEEYANLYKSEQRVATLSKYFAGFAIMISCLGLFGLAAFTAERRLKEIGIRKTLGSSSLNIVYLLSKDFTRLVLVSIVIALPTSYFLVQKWVGQFAYRIDLSIWIFFGAGLTALAIAWLTISSQAIKAANVNPVDCLRAE